MPNVGSDASRALTVETMQHYLSGHPQGSGAVVRSVHEIPGGRSKRTVLVSLDPSGSLPSELVLRLDTGCGTGTAVTDEHPCLPGSRSWVCRCRTLSGSRAPTSPSGFPASSSAARRAVPQVI